MQQDEQPNAEQTAEIPAPDAQVVPPPNGKKGGKQAAPAANQAQGGDVTKALQSLGDKLAGRIGDLEKAAKDAALNPLVLDRKLKEHIGGVNDDVEILRELVISMDKRLQAFEAEAPKRDARLLDAVSKYEKSVLKSLEATVAACEALTGMRPADARIVRQLIRELREARDGNGQTAGPTPPSPASRSAFWTGNRAALACGAMVVVALCCAYFL